MLVETGQTAMGLILRRGMRRKILSSDKYPIKLAAFHQIRYGQLDRRRTHGSGGTYQRERLVTICGIWRLLG